MLKRGMNSEPQKYETKANPNKGEENEKERAGKKWGVAMSIWSRKYG